MSVPAWKQAILNKKREKEEGEERARQEEQAKLKKLPQWKRDLLLRKQASEDHGSPPLNRASFGKSKLGRTGSLSKTPPVAEKHTLAAGRDRVGSDAGSDSELSFKPATPASVPSKPAGPATDDSRPTSTPAGRPSDSETTSTDEPDGGRPSVKHLLGLFAGAGRARSGSGSEAEDRPTETGLEVRTSSVGSARRQGPVAAAAMSASALKPSESSSKQESSSSTQDEGDDEECTLIDDVVPEDLAKPKFNKMVISPPRQVGVHSAPVSPTATTLNQARMERRPSALASSGKPRKMRRSVSFNELQMATVYHYDKVSSEPEEEEEPKRPLAAILKPIKSTPGISSSPSVKASSGVADSSSGGFQAFQPKILSDTTDSARPSWRSEIATPTKTIPEPEPTPPPEPAEEPEAESNTSALLW